MRNVSSRPVKPGRSHDYRPFGSYHGSQKSGYDVKMNNPIKSKMDLVFQRIITVSEATEAIS